MSLGRVTFLLRKHPGATVALGGDAWRSLYRDLKDHEDHINAGLPDDEKVWMRWAPPAANRPTLLVMGQPCEMDETMLPDAVEARL